MKAKAAPRFWKFYNRLPFAIQQHARKAYQLWKTNPSASSLRFKRVSKEEPIYSVRVGEDYRALGVLESDTIVWFWIGRHDEYERILKR